MRVASIPVRATVAGPLGSRRLLLLAGDERLVEQIRRGNEAAFEVAFERHAPAILAFCRHMLGSPDEAEDAVQHTFGAAYRDLERDREREIALKPWLFTIARNRCLSMLRARRDQQPALSEPATSGLAEQVEQRAELRRLFADLCELPVEQRCALLLAELGDLSHTEVAGVLGCEVQRVKALVYRARSRLIARREAREIPCTQIRQQLASLRGGSLRRTQLRLHLAECSGCRAYRQQVKAQRRMLAAALPVAPTLKLKTSVLAAAGIGGGAAGGGAAGALTGIAGTCFGCLGNATVAKVAVVGVIAGGAVAGGGGIAGGGAVAEGGAVAGEAALTTRHDPPAVTPTTERSATLLPDHHAGTAATEKGRVAASPEDRRRATHPRALPPDPGKAEANQERGPRTRLEDEENRGQGRGAVSSTPAPKLATRGPTHHPAVPNHTTPKPTVARSKPMPDKATPKPARPVPKPDKPQKAAPPPEAPAPAPAAPTTPSPRSPTGMSQRGPKW